MKKLTIGLLGVMLLLAVGVYAHGYSERNMHNEVEEILDSGTYEDLVELREEYGMPVMHWVDDAQEFEEAQEYHEISEETPYRRSGGCHGW